MIFPEWYFVVIFDRYLVAVAKQACHRDSQGLFFCRFLHELHLLDFLRLFNLLNFLDIPSLLVLFNLLAVLWSIVTT